MTTVVIEKQLAQSSTAIMRTVLLAMLPAVVISNVWLGVGIIIQLTLASVAAVICEIIGSRLRQHKLNKLDIYSGLISAWILALSIPCTAPWWLIVVGVVIAILLAKHCYGGMGMNIFNPAMVGFCVLYICYPEQLNQWPLTPVSIDDTLALIFTQGQFDASSGATALTTVKIMLNTDGNVDFSFYRWGVYQYMALSYVLSGLYLLYKRIIDWRLPVFMLAGVVSSHFALALLTETQIPLSMQLFSGATLFAAFFIITDPVTAATSAQAKIIFAFATGVLIVLLRKYNVMADAVAFSMLLANLCVPFLDDYGIKKYGTAPK